MKIRFIFFWITLIALMSCKDDDINLFDKSPDERVAEAIAGLKNSLTEPANGWRVKYRPEDGAGAYYVLMKFNDDNTVNIRTDLSANDGEFHDQTITYRIDNSLGLELVFESYSFFAYLFEQDQATFGAEYEFLYANKTPDGELVFTSKTDIGSRSTIVFEEAAVNDLSVLGRAVSENLDDFNSAAVIKYNDKDVAVYLQLNTLKRTARFNYVSPKGTTIGGKALNLETGYVITKDSIVFDSPLSTTIGITNVSINRLYLNELTQSSLDLCGTPKDSPLYKGKTQAGDNITLEVTLFNNEGAAFKTHSDIYLADIVNIFDENGSRVNDDIVNDLPGAALMLIYNNAQTDNGILNAIGFYFESNAIVVREGTSTFTGNIMEYTFDPDITILRGPEPDSVENIDIYLNKLTEGGKTYIYKYNESFYELYNPCSGWRFYFQAL